MSTKRYDVVKFDVFVCARPYILNHFRCLVSTAQLVTPFGSQKTFFDLIWKRLHPELTNISNSLNDTVAPPPPCIALPPPQPTHPPSPPYAGVMLNPRRASPSSMRGPIFRDVARRNNATYDYEPAVNNIYPRQGYATSTTHTMTTPLPSLASPPIVHRGKLSSRHIARLLNEDDDSQASQAINYDNARPSRQLCMIPKKRYLFSQRNTIANNENDSRLPSYPSSPPPPQQQHVAVSYSESDVSIAMILANGFGKSDDEHRDPKNESNASYS